MIHRIFVILVVALYDWALGRYPASVMACRLRRAIVSDDPLNIRFVMIGDDGIEHSLTFTNREKGAIEDFLGTPSDPICRLEIKPDGP